MLDYDNDNDNDDYYYDYCDDYYDVVPRADSKSRGGTR